MLQGDEVHNPKAFGILLLPQLGFITVFTARASLIAQLVKNPSALQEILVRFLDGEDPLEKG